MSKYIPGNQKHLLRFLFIKVGLLCRDGYSTFFKRIKQDSLNIVFHTGKVVSCLFT